MRPQENILSYRKDIDGLRALSVLFVIIYHAFPNTLIGGFVGVDVFFVISGFLISSIILEQLQLGRFKFLNFYKRRVKRIFPALFCMLLSCLLLGWVALFPDEFNQLKRYLVAGTAFFINFELWKDSGYFDVAAVNKPLLHLWSLAIEEQFYIFWPLLLSIFWKARKVLSGLILATILVSFGANVALIGSHPVAAFYCPLTRFWEILLGGWLASELIQSQAIIKKKGALENARDSVQPIFFNQLKRIFTDNQNLFLSNIKSTLGLLMLFTGAIASNRQTFPGWWAILPAFGAFLIISAGANAWINRVFFGNRLMVGIGLISYPLYLWHWPLFSYFRIIMGNEGSFGIRFGLIGLSFLLAAATYFGVEKPIRSRETGKIPRYLSFAMCILFVMGIGPLKSHNAKTVNELQLELDSGFIADRFGYNAPWQECHDLIHAQPAFCRMSKPMDKVKVALIGDSLANALYPGLVKEFGLKGIGVINMGESTCNPFRGLHESNTGNRCSENNDAIYSFILSNPQIDTVIMSLAAWDIKNVRVGSVPLEGSLEEKFSSMAVLVSRDLADLRAAGKKVIAIFDTPRAPWEPKDCIPRPLRTNVKESCVVNENQLIDREPYVSHWRKIFSTDPEICVFEASPFLKEGDIYQLFSKDGHLLFRDSHHFSVYGSEYIANQLMHSKCFQ